MRDIKLIYHKLKTVLYPNFNYEPNIYYLRECKFLLH